MITEGNCPICGKELEYGTGEPNGEHYCYDVTCPFCDFQGTENYKMNFTGFTGSDGKDYDK